MARPLQRRATKASHSRINSGFEKTHPFVLIGIYFASYKLSLQNRIPMRKTAIQATGRNLR